MAMLLAVPASASAAQTFGLGSFVPTGKCISPPRIYFGQNSMAPDPYVVPSNGVITSWTFRTGAGALPLVKLKVGTNITNRIVRTDAESQSVALLANTATANPTRIPVVTGQRIGVYVSADNTVPCFSTGFGINDSIITNEEPYDQTPGMTATYLPVGSWAFPVTAQLEADADGDGYGDETQDPCPAAGGPNGCPLPPPPATPSGSSGPAPAPAPDSTPPVLSPLSLSRSSFKATASTQVSYVLSEAGTVVLTVERKVPGRRVAGICKPVTVKNKTGKPCDRWLKAASFTAAGNAGPNVFTLPGRIGGKALTPGAYRLTVAATDTSRNASPVSQSRFTIVR